MMLQAEALSAQPGVRHGFFTRVGGVSEGPFAALNCGFGSGDLAARVDENRTLALARLEIPIAALCTAYQRHETTCVRVTAPWRYNDRPEADALVTDQPGIALGVLTADCAPVLLADRRAGVVCAAHAGWRGALAGIIETAVEGMAQLGARPADTAAAIGPTIGPASYEVGPEFATTFRAASHTNDAYFAPAQRDDHYMFDLPRYVTDKLKRLGVAEVAALPHDTCADAGRFFSYRRAHLAGEADYGRMLSTIALAE
jgi:YfiH family protein